MSVSAAIPEIWDKKILPNIYHNSVMANLVSTTYESKLKSEGGDTVKMPSVGDITLKDYTGGPIVHERPTVTNQELNISQHKYFSIFIDDVTKAQSNLQIMNGYKKSARNQTRLHLDTYLIGSQADVASANIIGTVGTPIALTSSNIYGYLVDLYVLLSEADALTDGEKPWLTLPPTIVGRVRKSDEFIHATQAGDKVIRTGKVGEIAGFEIFETTNLVAVSGNYHLLAGVRDAIEFALQVKKTEMCKPSDNFGDIYKGLLSFGRKTVYTTKLAKIIAT